MLSHQPVVRNQLFTAERLCFSPAASAKSAESGNATLAELREELRQLGDMLKKHFAPETTTEQPQEANDNALLEQYNEQNSKIRMLKRELKALSNSIEDTKREIAQLRDNPGEGDRLVAVAGELDSVVGSTEKATESILDLAEKIDSISQQLQSSSDSFAQQLGETITDHVMGIFEHCNFQDITGQRINKVVNTLKFVEDRVDKMISIWGSEAFADLMVETPTLSPEQLQDDRHLLNGPQQEGDGISQNDIDSMFG